MNKSKVEYALANRDGCCAIIWQTELGRIAVVDKPLDINGDISIIDCREDSETRNRIIDNIDLRNLFMEILPKESGEVYKSNERTTI